MDDTIKKILENNKDKGFVKRILSPKDYPVLDNKDGSTSTHSMSWSEVDGKYIVFPTVLYNDKGQLNRFDPNIALELSLDSGNFIEFDAPEKADFFSKEYKQAWEKPKKTKRTLRKLTRGGK